MLVVTDTSPLNYLIVIGEVSLLPRLYSRVATVPAVLSELRHTRSPESVQLWAASPPDWLEVMSSTPLELGFRLGRGEIEAMSLALAIHADLVLMDERRGTLAARTLGLTVTGTLGVLDLAAQRGLVQIGDALRRLQATTFRANAQHYAELILRHSKPAP